MPIEKLMASGRAEAETIYYKPGFRLRYAWYYRIKSPSGPSSALAALGTPQPSFGTLNAVEPCLTYPNLYLDRLYRIVCYALVMTNKVAREPAAGSDKNRLENRQPVWKGYN